MAGITEVKLEFKLSVKLKFIDALMLTNLSVPCIVKCSLFLTNSKACLNNSKSANFLGLRRKGYLSKWLIITAKSEIEVTTYETLFFDILILPTLKKRFYVF